MIHLNNKQPLISRSLFEAGGLLLGFIVCSAFISNFFYLVGLVMTPLNFWSSLSLLLVIYMLIYDKKKPINQQYAIKWLSLAIFAIILIISIVIAGKINDVSYDGNYYHKTAIGLMKVGWNPLLQPAADFSKDFLQIGNDKIFKWVDHYQNITWLFGSSIYAITNNIETAKAVNFVILAGVFLIIFYLIRSQRSKLVMAVVLTLTIVLSPIVVAQLFTFYVDGNLALIFYLYLALLWIISSDWSENGKLSRGNLILLGLTIAIMINIKLTGLVLFGVFLVPFGIFWLKKNLTNKNKSCQKIFLKLSTSLVICCLFSLLVIGAGSYVKNQVNKGNAFYPLLGADKADIITTMQPKSFEGKSQVYKLLVSLFSESDNISYYSQKEPTLKLPISQTKHEKRMLALPDTRIGGFGAIFGAIFIVSLGVVLFGGLVLHSTKTQKTVLTMMACLLTGTLVYLFLPTENWWARYAPNIYMLVPLAVLVLFKIYNKTSKTQKISKVMTLMTGAVLLVMLVVNLHSFFENRIIDLDEDRIINNQLWSMRAEVNQYPLEIVINEDFSGLVFNLVDQQIVDIGRSRDIKILGTIADGELINSFDKHIYKSMIFYRRG